MEVLLFISERRTASRVSARHVAGSFINIGVVLTGRIYCVWSKSLIVLVPESVLPNALNRQLILLYRLALQSLPLLVLVLHFAAPGLFVGMILAVFGVVTVLLNVCPKVLVRNFDLLDQR